MNKIAVFEDQYDQVRGAFIAANRKFFADQIIFEVFPTSQHFKNINKICEYIGVIVDIELAPHSELDGFNLIRKIRLQDPKISIVILSGNSKNIIHETLYMMNIHGVQVISKPISYSDLETLFTIFLKDM